MSSPSAVRGRRQPDRRVENQGCFPGAPYVISPLEVGTVKVRAGFSRSHSKRSEAYLMLEHRGRLALAGEMRTQEGQNLPNDLASGLAVVEQVKRVGAGRVIDEGDRKVAGQRLG